MMSDPDKRPGNNPSLVFTVGLRQGERISLRGATFVIGRDISADIQLESPYVSRQHAEITSEGGYWFVTDLLVRDRSSQ